MLRYPDQLFRRWVLVVYWAMLLILTHMPRTAPMAVPGGDKIAHFVAYALLALLLAAAWGSRGPVPNWPVLVAILAFTLGHAAFDELTQPLFGRYCSSADWIADACGAVVGLAVYAGCAVRRVPDTCV